jgi:hypothetical protein
MMIEKNLLDFGSSDEEKFFRQNTLHIDVQNTTGCFRLLGAVLENITTTSVSVDYKERKKKISRLWIKHSKGIDMWCDVAGYDKEVMVKALEEKLK